MEFDQIMPGSFFGGRTLPPFEIYMNLRKIYFGEAYLQRPEVAPSFEEESEEKYQLKSFLNVIADSGVVEVYKITKNELGYLNEKQQSRIFDVILQVKEPDRPETENVIRYIKEKII